jgi:hypothetical protein
MVDIHLYSPVFMAARGRRGSEEHKRQELLLLQPSLNAGSMFLHNVDIRVHLPDYTLPQSTIPKYEDLSGFIT